MFRQGYRSERRGNRRRQAEEQLAGHSSEPGQPNTSCYCVGVMIHKARLVSVLKNGPINAPCVILTYKCEAKWCQKHPWLVTVSGVGSIQAQLVCSHSHKEHRVSIELLTFSHSSWLRASHNILHHTVSILYHISNYARNQSSSKFDI